MSITTHDVYFCCIECERQRNVKPTGVYQMLLGLIYAKTKANEADFVFTEDFIKTIAGIVAPITKAEYRTIPVIFDNGQKGINSRLITDQMQKLVANHTNMDPIEFYKNFELIHPFVDGNGRVGSILYNLMRDTLNLPQLPPQIKWD